MNANPGLTVWLTQWNWQPSLLLGTIAVLGLYLYAVGPLRRRFRLGPAVPFAQAFAFFLGVDVIFLALFSPLDDVGDSYLFSAHMVQHLLLSLFAPPLIIIGIPVWLVQPLLCRRVTFTIGKWLTHPVFTSVIFTANLWIWHAPPIYDATLVSLPLHILSHLLYIGTGLLFWWPILGPSIEGWPRLSLGGKLAYIFFSDMPMVLLGAGLTFTPPLYMPYQRAPRIFGMPPDVDQQLGGLIMWIIGSIFLIVLVSILFLRWMQQQEEKQRFAEALDQG
jgi:cytochrome c oxidase assembly factor CtaG